MSDTAAKVGFRYSLENLSHWIVKYSDGRLIKFSKGAPLVNLHTPKGGVQAGNYKTVVQTVTYPASYKLKEWCKHDVLSTNPLYLDPNKKFGLWVADAMGVRTAAREKAVDMIIDCGDAIWLQPPGKQGWILQGDKRMVEKLRKHAKGGDPPPEPRPYTLFKIGWDDRQAPVLEPGFWPELATMLKGKVAINCQGGHGRSGTAFVCLLMALIPDYTPLDAILHLRGLHCPRAIESAVQHQYINTVADFLGREMNAFKAEKVEDYKAAFTASKHPEAVRIQAVRTVLFQETATK